MTSTGQAMKTPKKRNEETQMANNYIIPAVERESVNGIQEVSLLTEAFTNRRIFIFGEIDEETVFSFTVQMLNLMEDEQSEINIYINTPGGEVNAGLAIYDLIQSCKAPVNMYCIGMAASMGAIIFAGGQKGQRSILRTRKLLNGILAKHTGRKLSEINKATDHNNFMTATEAIEFGLCDKVVNSIL